MAIKSLKNNKTPGDDLILNEMLKSASDVLAPAVVKVFKHISSTGLYPIGWNTGCLIPTHKKGGYIKM